MIRSCQAFDAGHFSEAKRLAVALRVLLHDTPKSHSLLKQLGLKSIGFLDTAFPCPKKEDQVFLGLLKTQITINDDLSASGQHHPLLHERPHGNKPRKKFFADWWNQVVLIDMHRVTFSRREIIMAVANTDGGAHVDPELDESYARLSRENSIGYGVGMNGQITQIDKSELVSIRQIAYEVLTSLENHGHRY